MSKPEKKNDRKEKKIKSKPVAGKTGAMGKLVALEGTKGPAIQEEAARLLGRHYAVSGPIAPGRGIGKREIVPTLNMAPYPELLPMRGVYVTETECAGHRGQSVTNIGYNPTVGETALHLESHYLDAPPAGWTHGAEMRVTFRFRIRDEIKFPSMEALRERIGRDVRLARRYFAKGSRLSLRKMEEASE